MKLTLALLFSLLLLCMPGGFTAGAAPGKSAACPRCACAAARCCAARPVSAPQPVPAAPVRQDAPRASLLAPVQSAPAFSVVAASAPPRSLRFSPLPSEVVVPLYQRHCSFLI